MVLTMMRNDVIVFFEKVQLVDKWQLGYCYHSCSYSTACLPVLKSFGIHIRYTDILGALARSGWLPQGFTLRSAGGGLSSSAFEKKRHIGALAKLGWISNVQESPAYYYRGGRGRNFRTSSFRGPRAYFLKSENKHGRCQCKRNSNSRLVQINEFTLFVLIVPFELCKKNFSVYFVKFCCSF